MQDSFYRRNDVVSIARDLLGLVLVTQVDGMRTSGIITETEAYAGPSDRASHAYGGRVTKRNQVMYLAGGVAYVYLCYGIHHLFNVVTNVAGVPHAVLIRAVEPLDGVDTMCARRGHEQLSAALTAGPGALTVALGIDGRHNGMSLCGTDVFIEKRGTALASDDIVSATRVGVAYAGEDAYLPYRFYIKGSKFVSKAKGL